jgi:hypothetical protein
MAENKLQKAANEIVKCTKETGFNISVEKTKAMLIHRRNPRVYQRPKLKVRLGPNAIEMVKQHRIVGLIIGGRLTSRQETGATKDTSTQKMGRRSKNVT